jgi:hypothetical protein
VRSQCVLALCKCGKEISQPGEDPTHRLCDDCYKIEKLDELGFHASKGVSLPAYWDQLSHLQKEAWLQYDDMQRTSFDKWFLSGNQKSGIDAQIEEERKTVGFHSDELSKARYHSYLALKGQACDICHPSPTPSLTESSGEVSFVKVQSIEPVENQPDFDATDQVVVPGSSRIVKDLHGRYVAQTTFTLKKKEKEQLGENKTFVFNLGDLVFRIYKRKHIEDGKLAFVVQARGKNISRFPMDLRKRDIRKLLAMCIYLLNRESSQKRHSLGELPRRYVVSKQVAEIYRELFLQEELGLKYTSQVESVVKTLSAINNKVKTAHDGTIEFEKPVTEADEKKLEEMNRAIEEEVMFDVREQERWDSLSEKEKEEELREMEAQDKMVDEMIEEETSRDSGRDGEMQE